MVAADRAMKYLPTFAAQIIFIGTTRLTFANTAAVATANSPSPTTFINMEARSITFSALYFQIIPTVIVASVNRLSQTKHAIHRILQRFQEDPECVFASRSKVPIDSTKTNGEGWPGGHVLIATNRSIGKISRRSKSSCLRC